MAKSSIPVRGRVLSIITVGVSLLAGLLTRGDAVAKLEAQSNCNSAANPIVCENLKPGDPSSQWDVSGAGDPTIQGFATNFSITVGQTQGFKIDTPSNSYGIDIYRMGHYGGAGARKVATISPSVPLPQNQPNCLNQSSTGLIDCGNWSQSASWTVPADAVSGIYFAKLNRFDTGGSSHVFFIVKESDSAAHHSDIVFQTADTTWQAYNSYGGNSLYTGNPAGRAYKVSYNRPFTTRGNAPEDWVFNAEYPMVRFLEANGYDVSYISGIDADRFGTTILTPSRHRIYLSVGHDEYWSGAQRANIEAARAAGLHLAFFSGNEMFWKTRWENSIDASNTPYRTLVCYKETHADAVIDPQHPTWTGTWRDPRFSPPADGGRPENAVTGQLFMVNAGFDAAITIPAALGKMRFWRNTSIASLSSGDTATLPDHTLGYEWDADVDNGFRPNGFIALSETTETISGGGVLLDHGSSFGSGTVTHRLSLYRHPSGALVFGAGTVQWAWGLDSNHDRGSAEADVRMKQATVNLFADMGVQPGTLDPELVAAIASDDEQAPTSVITWPAGGESLTAGTIVNITGTASEAGGGELVGVEVSIDDGATWFKAEGTAGWQYSWTPTGAGSVTIKSRAYDDSGNMETPSSGVTVSVGSRVCPCSIWSDAVTPPAPHDDGDPASVELGVKFQSEIAGYITAVRFYKDSANTGTHTGSLWTNAGSLLSTVTFAGETVSGWQQMNLPSPVPIAANTTYVVSYHAPLGHYTGTDEYFLAAGIDNAPLHVAGSATGSNSVFTYSPSTVFPTNEYNGENYWVDVVFETNVDITPPTVIAQSPVGGATGVDPAGPITASFSEAMDPASITTATFTLHGAGGSLVTAAVAYNAATHVATLTPSAPLADVATYTVTIVGGAPGVKDLMGNHLTATLTTTFVTADVTAPVITNVVPAAGTLGVARSSAMVVTFSEALDPTGVNANTIELRDPSGALVAGTVTYDGLTHVASLQPLGPLAPAATFTFTIKGGASGIKDAAGNALATDQIQTFTTAGAPTIGVTARGRYGDESNDYAVSAPVTTQAISNFVVYVHGEGGSSDYPTVTDSYNNVWTPRAVRRTSAWPGFLWIFTSLNAAGGAGHAFTATKPGSYPTILMTEVLGSNVTVADLVTGTDNTSPHETPPVTVGGDALLLGAFAPGWPGDFVSITPGSGFGTLVEEVRGDGAWVATVASRTVQAGTFAAAWTMSGGVEDFDFGVGLVALNGTPHSDTAAPSVVSLVPADGAAGAISSTVRATFSEPVDPLTVNSATFEVKHNGVAIPGVVSYDNSTKTASLTPGNPLIAGQIYGVRLAGGSAGVKDLASNPLAADVVTTFTASASPALGVSVEGRYGDESADWAWTAKTVETQSTTNFMVYVTGEGGNADFPVVTDTYNNTFTPMAVQQTSAWPGYLWVFASFNAAGGPGHRFFATKAFSYPSVVVVEVPGADLTLADSLSGIDNVSPHTTGTLQVASDALLLGAFAPSFPDAPITITPGDGFATIAEVNMGGAWTQSVAGKTVLPGSYAASWTKSGGIDDFDFGLQLMAVKFANGEPALSISDLVINEPAVGTANASFTVTLSHASSGTVTVNYTTAPGGSAISGSDFEAVSGTITFPAGVTQLSVEVPVLADGTTEGGETFGVSLSGAVNATYAKPYATGTILDDTEGP